jgi:hypothetical protein
VNDCACLCANKTLFIKVGLTHEPWVDDQDHTKKKSKHDTGAIGKAHQHRTIWNI